MARGRSGGYRTPSEPAPVSLPGAGSERTDSGPRPPTQPIRVASGGAYGTRQALEAQQRAVPLPTDPGLASPGAGRGRGTPAAAPTPLVDPFGPSRRPTEPGNRGVAAPAQLDAFALLRMLYSKRPSPWLAEMMEQIRPVGS